ncbi:5-formyltetrahydrofolate cyclo-ligase [Zooshikella ganghwensis]|uniref:5-formyltetrahydrofolate cyclo-ligase n=1 Tax=Zooshikella ganghwensis TaxID=202772 RepID=A0A4P9VIM1_9GAMM|nr:5-formyltetrahydrofolate cyclo-ligase [Zooshikella ganghwensis]RDH42047.1 5-formyltetrahydrofolate cyclo-ligase [Zooshikella ganghwensis]
MNPTRKTLRTTLRQKRRQLSKQQQQLASERLLTHLKKNLTFIKSKTVAVYIASDGEINLTPTIRFLWKLGKQVFLPVLRPDTHNKLWFVHYQPHTNLILNNFNIPEPTRRGNSIIAPWALDLVLLPLVGFDIHGGRLGMGGGFYDRTFAFIQARPTLRHPKLMGVAHACQRVDKLSVASWDIPLNAIVTDQQMYHC